MSSILIAEDDPAIREGLEAALQSDGHETRAAANGVEALARIAERRPDLLLLDVMMPGKSGWDVCAELRRRDPALPIVFLTAKGEEADKVLGLGLGADDYVVKPFGVRELLARVRAALRRAGSGRVSRLRRSMESGVIRFRVAGCLIVHKLALSINRQWSTTMPMPRGRTAAGNWH